MGCCGQEHGRRRRGSGGYRQAGQLHKGMLLGVDDFVQEQAWGIARRHELAREVLGYGTVRGCRC